ncbi:MAG: glycoside hydrolase family 9 protein [Treponema sp.]|nr:glycoside hydrolase family 9 protein [Treponema sp.]
MKDLWRNFRFLRAITVVFAFALTGASLLLTGCDKKQPGSRPGSTYYLLIVSADPNSFGSVECDPQEDSYLAGSKVKVTAKANPGYVFDGWEGLDDSYDKDSPVIQELIMNNSKEFKAKFIAGSRFNLTITRNPTAGGPIPTRSPSKSTYMPNETVTVTASANSGYSFTGWTGDVTDSNPVITVTMNANKTITANYQLTSQSSYTLTVNRNPVAGGNVTKNPDKASYSHGETVTVTASANIGYYLKNWSGALTATASSVIITMDGNKTLTANFDQLDIVNPGDSWWPTSEWRPDAQQPADIWRIENAAAAGAKLKDLYVFYQGGENKQGGNGYNDGNNFVKEAGEYNGGEIFRVNSNGQIMFAFHGWGAFSLEQYYNNGVVEFDVQSTGGTPSFQVGLRTDTKNFVVTHSVNTTRYGTINTSWQHFSIPIKDITDTPNSPSSPNPQFTLSSIMLLEINGASSGAFKIANMKISSTDGEAQHPIIKVNQAGYRVNGDKYALVSYFPGKLSGPADMTTSTQFQVRNMNGSEKKTGTLTLVNNNDPTSGERVFRADFTDVRDPGDYYISIISPPVHNSFKFTIRPDVYDGLWVDTLRYYFYQREGLNLSTVNAGPWARNKLHNDTQVIKWSQRNNSGSATKYDVSQGWYDAGDFGKYILPASTTVSDLLLAYEAFPGLFRDNQLNIPESGNGSPDFLDEIKWELDMILKFEDRSTGGFWHVANYNGNTIYIVDTRLNGNTTGDIISTSATAGVSAILAHAYIVYKDIPTHAAFADTCLAASKRAWTYLEGLPANTNNWVEGAGRNYEEDIKTVNIMKFWAACTLYRATGEAKYNTYVTSNYTRDSDFAVSNKNRFNPSVVLENGVFGAACIHYAKSAWPSKSAAVDAYYKSKFTTFKNGILGYYNAKNWPTMLIDWAYWWGCNTALCRSPAELYLLDLAYGLSASEQDRSISLIRDSVHYILGINPLGFSFVSGYGGHSVKNIFSGIFTYNYDKNNGFAKYSIPPGYMAGGSNMYDMAFSSNYPGKMYVDSDREWTTNEHAIYYEAALVLLLTLEKGTAP